MRLKHLLISFLLLAACGQKEANPNEATPSTPSEPEPLAEFIQFYEQFHQDSIFQMEHILFPLAGMPSMLTNEAIPSDFRWQREEWRMQKPLDPEGEFKQQFSPVDDALIIEYIVHQTGKYAMERRFAKLGEEWNLIYYSDLNAVK